MTELSDATVRAMPTKGKSLMKVLMFWSLLLLSTDLPTFLKASSPRLEYESSWIGNSYPGGQRWVPQDIDHIFVTADGTVYSNVHWEEGGGNVTAFKDGEVLGPARRTHGWGNQGGYAVAANNSYLYIGGRMNNEGGGLKDPDTWPPKGFDWIGVSRRLRSDIQKGAPFPSGKGGKGDTLPGAFLVVDEVPVGSGPAERRLRNITGLWATKDQLYVSCPYNSTITVFDAESMARLAEWSVERPGVLAMDRNSVLWTLLEPDAMSPQEIIAMNPRTGERTGPTIHLPADVEAKAICFTADGRLLVADTGPAQQIHIYEFPSGEPPRLAGTFGVRGGIYAHPSGRFGDLRFNMPSAVGSDAAGNIYVAHRGSTGGGSTMLESYTANGTLHWRLFGLHFVDMADVDPASDTEVFTKEERFTMDYSKPPGRQWTYEGYTVHPFRYPQDPRLHIWSAGAWVRRMENRRFLFVNDMNAQYLQVYRFDAGSDDETAIPSGLFAGRPIRNDKGWPPHQPQEGEWIWRDRDGNGAFDPGEYDRNEGQDAPSYQGWWVDNAGTVWQATQTRGIRRFPMHGLDEYGNPVWDYSSMTVFDHPPEFKEVKRLRYDPATDVMVLGGTTDEHANQHWKPMGPVLARYDNWSGPNRALRWKIVAPYEKGASGHQSGEPMGFDMAGEYLFVPYTGASREMGFSTGHIEVFRLNDGSSVGHMEPSEEIGEIGLQDIRECLRAHPRSDGEYLVFLEEDYKAKILLYRWKP
jgi:hypothetical protein